MVGPHLPLVLSDVSPEGCQVLAEEQDGEIVGTCAVLKATHLEGLWIHDDHRNPGTARSLLRAAVELAQGTTAHGWVFACVGSDEVAAQVERLGGQEVPVRLYVLPLKGKE